MEAEATEQYVEVDADELEQGADDGHTEDGLCCRTTAFRRLQPRRQV